MSGDELARGAKSKSFLPINNAPMAGEGVFDPQPQRTAVAEPEELVSRVDNSSLFKRKEPKRYRGKAIGRFLLIERLKKDEDGLLVIPDAYKAKSEIGRIYSIGATAEARGLKVGDLVMFDRFATVGAESELIGEDGKLRELLVMQDLDVIMQLEEVDDPPAE